MLEDDIDLDPVIINQELYNKCLFKTISLSDLTKELKERYIKFDSDETYYLLTLKIRAHILNASNAHPRYIQPVLDEIKFLSSNTKKKYYACSYPGCPFKTGQHNKYVEHLRLVHSTNKQNVECKLKGCSRVFLGVSQLEIHLKTAHRSRQSSVALRQRMFVNQIIRMKCSMTSCGHQIVPGVKELKKHLTSHLEKRETVQCIFKGCKYETNSNGSMGSHISRKHRYDDVDNLKDEIRQDNDADSSNDTVRDLVETNLGDIDDEIFEDVDVTTFSLEDQEQEEIAENESCQENSQEIFLRALAITFCDWMSVKAIPFSTCNIIVAEVFKSYGLAKDQMRLKICEILRKEGFDTAKIEQILSELEHEDPFTRAKGELETESRRIRFLKESYDYTSPETVFLPTKKGEKRESYQYVPLKQSLKALLEDSSFLKQKSEDDYFHEPDVYKDIRDGDHFRTNTFFKENPEAIRRAIKCSYDVISFRQMYKLCHSWFILVATHPPPHHPHLTSVKNMQTFSKSLLFRLLDLEYHGPWPAHCVILPSSCRGLSGGLQLTGKKL